MKNKTNIGQCLNFVTGFKKLTQLVTKYEHHLLSKRNKKIMVFLCTSSDFLNFVTDFSWGTN